jgi:A nuclease of the HNH/ENDO VII superfamily with conserved WHH
VGKGISLIKSSRVASTVNTTLKSTQENLLKLVLQFFSKGTRYDGVRIINKKFAGQTYNLSGDLAKKYSKGVKFTKDGFPDFSPYSKAIVKIDGLKGNTSSDFTAANKALGIKTTPSGYTWHHVEDGRTLMLVPTELHQAVRHTGGAALLKKAYHRDV